jgi:ribose-phosphate pyrophosphokinase
MAKDKILIFSGSSNRILSKKIVECLELDLGKSVLGTFSDGEIKFQIKENVRGSDVFVIQSLTEDINFHIMELLIMADAFKRASARRITAVIPYYAYARQDRKDRPRVPISARLLADLIETAGFSRVLTVDLHADQIQGFFNKPVDNLMALPVFINHFRKEGLYNNNLVVVSPDAGGAERARFFAKMLKATLAIADKRRPAANISEIVHIIGDVEGKTALIVDDIVDTAGTMVKTVEALLKNGAVKVYAACTHGIFSGNAIEKINKSSLEEIFITDTIPVHKQKSKKIKVLSISELFAHAIESINSETSVSKLFL